jgi:hypothetical protein
MVLGKNSAFCTKPKIQGSGEFRKIEIRKQPTDLSYFAILHLLTGMLKIDSIVAKICTGGKSYGIQHHTCRPASAVNPAAAEGSGTEGTDPAPAVL